MAASRMQLLSPRNISVLSRRGRIDLFAGSGAARRAGDGPRGRPLNSSPLSFRTLSSVSETRRGLPREKMTENGVSSKAKVLTIDTMNPRVKKVEYAVRGPIVQRAVELEKELSQVLTVRLSAFQTRLPNRITAALMIMTVMLLYHRLPNYYCRDLFNENYPRSNFFPRVCISFMSCMKRSVCLSACLLVCPPACLSVCLRFG